MEFGAEEILLGRLKAYIRNVCVSLFDLATLEGEQIFSEESELHLINFQRNDSQLYADLIHHDDHRKTSLPTSYSNCYF